ncbi:MAG: MTH938/NDUFAF3 family protein, partial [Pseudomonadota bacterium]|nr:MTH938/NDUFAF3 family protein [Pseudomonadota bacterium]
GLGVEAMASPAACRTYNVLLSEGRRVGLALLPVGPADTAG